MMKKDKTAKIELTEDEIHLFKLMRKYQRQLFILAKHQVFDWSNGKIVIHKDPDGNIDRVIGERVEYKHGKS